MIANNFLRIDGDVHRAQDGASAVRFAGQRRTFYREYAEQIRNSQNRPVRTSILTPRSFDKKREQKDQAENDKRAPGNLHAPEVEQCKVRVIGFEDQCTAGGSDIYDP